MAATFKCREIQEENLFKGADDHRADRQFQPGHAPLITELRGESLNIFLECGVSLFHMSNNVPCFIVFSAWNISDGHTLIPVRHA